jgi:hypothetical protein
MFRPRARADSEGLASEVKTLQRNARSISAMKLLANVIQFEVHDETYLYPMKR